MTRKKNPKDILRAHEIVAKAIEDLYRIDRLYERDWIESEKITDEKLKKERRNRIFAEDPQKILKPEVMLRLMDVAQNLKTARNLTFLNAEHPNVDKKPKIE